MPELFELLRVLGSMPPGILTWIAVLAAFGLAAFAIHAVVTVAKDRR